MADFVTDGFGGTENDLLSTYSASWVKQTGHAAGNAEIASSRARASNATTAMYYHNTTPPSADYKVSTLVHVLSTAANGLSVCARCTSSGAGTFYLARYLVGTGVSLFKFVSGSVTQLGSTVSRSVTAGNSYKLELVVNGSSLSVYWNNESTPLITATDTAITAAGFPALRWSNFGGTPSDTVGLAADDFVAADLVTATVFSLDKYTLLNSRPAQAFQAQFGTTTPAANLNGTSVTAVASLGLSAGAVSLEPQDLQNRLTQALGTGVVYSAGQALVLENTYAAYTLELAVASLRANGRPIDLGGSASPALRVLLRSELTYEVIVADAGSVAVLSTGEVVILI